MAAAPAVLPPPPREAQRLGATIALSVLVHALLNVLFAPAVVATNCRPSLKSTLLSKAPFLSRKA